MRPMNAAMCAVITMACGLPPAAADFAVQDGDVVVFLGDSITAAREYGKIIEQYTLLRYQAWLLKMPTDARNELDNARKLSGEYLKTNPDRPAADEQAGRIIAEVEELQRLIARPAPYRFVIRKAN